MAKLPPKVYVQTYYFMATRKLMILPTRYPLSSGAMRRLTAMRIKPPQSSQVSPREAIRSLILTGGEDDLRFPADAFTPSHSVRSFSQPDQMRLQSPSAKKYACVGGPAGALASRRQKPGRRSG